VITTPCPPPGAYRGAPHDPVGPLDPGVIMSADMKFHFRSGAKVCSVVIMVVLVVGALGPAVLAAALVAELFIRLWRLHANSVRSTK
jgi:hypothetical protein